MDKSKAIERLNALESEAKELRKIIETPEQPQSLLTKPVAGSGVRYWSLLSGAYQKLQSFGRAARTETPDFYNHGNIFQSENLADAYADAIDTLLLLRHQPGTVPVKDGVDQWLILPRRRSTMFHFGFYRSEGNKVECISPCFDTEDHARQAVEAIGTERILRMFKTLHHVS